MIRRVNRNRRASLNANLKNITREWDERPIKNRTTKEEWVIRRVTEIVGTKAGLGFVKADDVASDVILALLEAGGFGWEEDEIETFCRKKAAYMVLKYLSGKECSECEFVSADGRRVDICDWAQSTPAMQETIIDARYHERCLRAIPDRQREALEILCDGGNPIDVAEEMGITPWAAIALIKEGRDYIDRV